MERNFYVMGHAGAGQVLADFFHLMDCTNTQEIEDYEDPKKLFFVDAYNGIIMADRKNQDDLKLFDFIRELFPERSLEGAIAFVNSK